MSTLGRLQVRCPKCNSADVRLSHTEGMWDWVLDLLFSMDAYRCRACRARFHKFDPGDDEEEVIETDRPAATRR